MDYVNFSLVSDFVPKIWRKHPNVGKIDTFVTAGGNGDK